MRKDEPAKEDSHHCGRIKELESKVEYESADIVRDMEFWKRRSK